MADYPQIPAVTLSATAIWSELNTMYKNINTYTMGKICFGTDDASDLVPSVDFGTPTAGSTSKNLDPTQIRFHPYGHTHDGIDSSKLSRFRIEKRLFDLNSCCVPWWDLFGVGENVNFDGATQRNRMVVAHGQATIAFTGTEKVNYVRVYGVPGATSNKTLRLDLDANYDDMWKDLLGEASYYILVQMDGSTSTTINKAQLVSLHAEYSPASPPTEPIYKIWAKFSAAQTGNLIVKYISIINFTGDPLGA